MKTRESIIIVDDDELNLKLYRKIFSEAGYDVSTAHNSVELFTRMSTELPDLILLDIVLGAESGLEILERIKADDHYRHVYVVMITGKLRSSDDQAYGLEIGADGYLTRPIEKRELLARVEAYMRHKRSIDELRRSEAQLRKIIDRNPDAILVVDPEGNIRFANPAAEELFSITMDDLLSRVFGYPVIKGEHTEINIVRNSDAERVAEMRTIDIDWENKPHFLTSIRDISQRKAAERKIQVELEEKRTLLQELYHRTKNNMNVIRSLLSLNAEKYDSPEVQELVRNTENRIQAMSLVHQMLHQSESLTHITLRPYIEELAQLLLQSQADPSRTIQLDLEVDEIEISIEKTIPLGISLNELISNALEHAFANGRNGRIQIQIRKESAGNLAITFADDGVGVDPAFDFGSSKTLGLRLIRGLIEGQLSGRIAFNSDNGVRCDISIPLE